jgi:hypothetical protein
MGEWPSTFPPSRSWDERQAAEKADAEALRLSKLLESDKERSASYKLENVQRLNACSAT